MIQERGHWKKCYNIWRLSHRARQKISENDTGFIPADLHLQVKCDPATLVQRDNPRYQVCLRHREFIADYLSVLDCELVHDPQEHIFRITGMAL